jgi:glycosyltransferase involved in cell wall biosynthesis
MTEAPTLPSLAGRTVLQVLPALVGGGVERGTVDMAAAIVEAGGTAIVASEGGPMVRELERAGATHVSLPLASKSPATIWRNAGRLARLIRAHDVDLVHARSRAPAWSALLACRRTGTPFVTTMHAPYPYRSALKRRYNAVMTRGDRVIAISDYVARDARERYGLDPAVVRTVPRGVDTARFAPGAVNGRRVATLAERWRLPVDRRVVLMPARLSRWKGQAVLIEAMALLGRTDLRCMIVGADPATDAYRRELEALARARGVDTVVQIADLCDDMPAAYMLADVVVHASTEPEGFGRVVAEAMAMGRPVIATDLGAPPEIVEDGRTGWLVPPGDAKALADAIGRALGQSPEQRDRMARAARDRVAARYTARHMAAATLAVYRELWTAAVTPGAG